MDELDPRFDGIQRLYGAAALARLRSAHVAVMGIGGVGSWAVEALARSGVGELTLVDLDDICASNINRQLHALTNTVGRFKVDVMAERIAGIHPDCRVHCVHAFFTEASASALLDTPYDVVIDAFDSARLKAELVARCRERNQRVLVSGASGGRRDPTQLRVADLAETYNDSLLNRVRKTLRSRHGFPRGGERFGVKAVFSAELPVFPTATGEVCSRPDPGETPTRLGCANGYGAASFVTGAFGFALAAAAISSILERAASFDSRPYSTSSTPATSSDV